MLPAPGNARGRLGSSGSSRVRERLKDRRQREGGRERGKNRKLLRNTSGLTLSAPPHTHTGRNLVCGTQSVGLKSQEAKTNVAVPGALQCQKIVSALGLAALGPAGDACWRPGEKKWPRKCPVVCCGQQARAKHREWVVERPTLNKRTQKTKRP